MIIETKNQTKTEEKESPFPWRIRLGSIFGMPFYFHISIFLWILPLITFENKIEAMLLLGILLFSITVHELSHALVCRFFNLGQGTLTIWAYGGYFMPFFPLMVSEMNQSQRLRYALMILAGPLSNLLLAAIFMMLMQVTPLPWLLVAAQVNLGLAIFNLLPIHWLDGSQLFLFISSVFATFPSWRRSLTMILVSVVLGIAWLIYFSSTFAFAALGVSLLFLSLKWQDLQKQISDEVSYVETSGKSRFQRLLGMPLLLGLLVCLGATAWYLGTLSSIYAHLPGKLVYPANSIDSSDITVSAASGFTSTTIQSYIEEVRSADGSGGVFSLNSSGSFLVFECRGQERLISLCVTDLQGKPFGEFPVIPDENYLYKIFWLGDDRRVAYSLTNSDGIWILDTRNGENRQIWPNGYIWDLSRTNDTILMIGGQDQPGAYVLMPDGKVRNLSNDPAIVADPLALSPDGQTAYFSDGASKVYSVNLSDTSSKPVAWPQTLGCSPSRLVFAPDGKQVILDCEGANYLYLANADGSNLRLWMSDSERPAWSPDGRFIAYFYKYTELMIARADGSWPMRVGQTADLSFQLAWIPEP